jgi:hypothetical protein
MSYCPARSGAAVRALLRLPPDRQVEGGAAACRRMTCCPITAAPISVRVPAARSPPVRPTTRLNKAAGRPAAMNRGASSRSSPSSTGPPTGVSVRTTSTVCSPAGRCCPRTGDPTPRRRPGRLERGISADALRREVLAQAHEGKTDLSADQGQGHRPAPVAYQHGEVGAVETRDGYAVLPKVLADRWKAATRDPRLFGRILDRVNKRFVRAVLPLSAMWHACGCRSRISRAGTRAQRGGHADPPGANGRAPRGRRFGTPAAAGPCRPRRGSAARAGC